MWLSLNGGRDGKCPSRPEAHRLDEPRRAIPWPPARQQERPPFHPAPPMIPQYPKAAFPLDVASRAELCYTRPWNRPSGPNSFTCFAPVTVEGWGEAHPDEWRSTLAAEIDGAMLCMKYVLPEMRRRKWGRIVNMGLQGASQSRGAPAPAYCLGKAARAWMTEVLADPHWGKGITVNCIELGYTAYLSLEDAVVLARGDDPEAEVTALAPETLKKMWTSAWGDHPKPTCFDIAEIVAFLCSDAGLFVTGSLIRMPNRS